MHKYLKNNLSSLTEKEISKIVATFNKTILKKGEYLLKEGEYCKKFTFVIKGAFLYFNLLDGEEKVCDFAFENDWVTNIKSISENSPSTINIRTLEDSEIYYIYISEFQKLLEEIPSLINLRSQLTEQYFFDVNERISDLTSLNSEELYHKIFKEKPQLIHRVPQYYLASYLGIKPQSLSRIRTKK